MIKDRFIPIMFMICAALGCSRGTESTNTQPTISSAQVVDSAPSSNFGDSGVSEDKPQNKRVKDLIIVDAAGQPISNATIQGTAASMGGPRFYSDDDGQANIPFAVQPIQWVTVSKTGFKTNEMIDIGQTRPIRITLEPGEGTVRPSSGMGSGDSSLDSGQK